MNEEGCSPPRGARFPRQGGESRLPPEEIANFAPVALWDLRPVDDLRRREDLQGRQPCWGATQFRAERTGHRQGWVRFGRRGSLIQVKPDWLRVRGFLPDALTPAMLATLRNQTEQPATREVQRAGGARHA